MRNAINNSSNINGISASNVSAVAMIAARDARTLKHHAWKRLPKVEVPVVPVTGSLCERPETRCMTTGYPTAMWQTASEMPAAAWAAFVLNRTTSV